MSNKELAKKIALDLFKIGDEPFGLTHRIAFMGVDKNSREDNGEIEMGGLCLESLEKAIENSIKEFNK